MLRRFRRHPLSRRFGGAAGRAGRRAFGGLLDVVLPAPGNRRQEELRDVRKLLLVRANFRIGNALMATPLVLALRERFPGARIDVLTGDTTASLLEHLPVGRIHAVSRLHLLEPWRFVALFARLRRERYDLAVEGGLGSFSGGLYAYLTGARDRLGCAGKGERFLTVRLAPVPWGHAYDAAVHVARELGVACPDRPVYAVAPAAAEAAARLLAEAGMERDGTVRPFAALFVGGHEGKRWSLEGWLALAQRLHEAGHAAVVLVGPEEVRSAGRLRAALPAGVPLVMPQPLAVFAGLLERATVVVTPDSGPMHVAAGLGRPTVAILQSERSQTYAPRGAEDRVLVRPSASDVARVVADHPAWRRDAGVAVDRAAAASPRGGPSSAR